MTKDAFHPSERDQHCEGNDENPRGVAESDTKRGFGQAARTAPRGPLRGRRMRPATNDPRGAASPKRETQSTAETRGAENRKDAVGQGLGP